jgi:predicted dehydrogenase
MTKIKVGIVGTGFIGPAHIEALRRLPNIDVAALCEVTIELAEAKAKHFRRLIEARRYPMCTHLYT